MTSLDEAKEVAGHPAGQPLERLLAARERLGRLDDELARRAP